MPSKGEMHRRLTDLEERLEITRDVTMTDEDRLIVVCEKQQDLLDDLQRKNDFHHGQF